MWKIISSFEWFRKSDRGETFPGVPLNSGVFLLTKPGDPGFSKSSLVTWKTKSLRGVKIEPSYISQEMQEEKSPETYNLILFPNFCHNLSIICD